MKTYHIYVKCWTTLVVEAEDNEDALEIASDELLLSGADVDEFRIEGELKTEAEIASAIRHSPWHQDQFEKEPFRREGP